MASSSLSTKFDILGVEYLEQVSVDADGTRATMPQARSTIALYAELDAEHDQQPTVFGDCRLHWPRLSSSPSTVNTRPPVVVVYIAFDDSRRGRAVANFLSRESLGQSSRGKNRYFWRYPNFSETRCSINRDKSDGMQINLTSAAVSIQYRRVTDTQIYDDR